MAVLLGKGDGTFQKPDPDNAYLYTVVPPGGSAENPIMVIIVDLDQDAFGDLVTTNQVSDNISVRINSMIVTIPP